MNAKLNSCHYKCCLFPLAAMVHQWRGSLFHWTSPTSGLAGHGCTVSLFPTHPPYHNHLSGHSEGTHNVHSHLSGNFMKQESLVFKDNLNIFFSLQTPRWLRHFVPPLTAVFREELKWWSGVELGRRFLFLLFFIPFPRNAVRNIQNQYM